MLSFNKDIIDGKGAGWLRTSLVLWVVSLILLVSDLTLRVYSSGYREWSLEHLAKEGACCPPTMDANWAMSMFSLVSFAALICIGAMFAAALLVILLRRRARALSLIIAAAVNILALWLVGDSLYTVIDDTSMIPVPDIGIIGFLCMFAAIEVGAIGILLLALNIRPEADASADINLNPCPR